ncbi:hypothetical protein [Arthrobacter castelli]|uniref:hypothetical protein n=1 Tax=Arthrobacter castelli TaxID=271431 RepID=UPI000405267A|nr:hypothetical protein [Arthrobacter castelli]
MSYTSVPVEGTETDLTAEQAARRAGLSLSYFKNRMAVLNRSGRDLRAPRTEKGPRKYDLGLLDQWIEEGKPSPAAAEPTAGAKKVRATATRENGQWKVTIDDEAGTLFCRSLDSAERDAHVSAATLYDLPAEEIDLKLTVALPEDAAGLWVEAQKQRQIADEASKAASAASRRTVAALKDDGFTFGDIGRMLGVSPGRAQQLAAGSQHVGTDE